MNVQWTQEATDALQEIARSHTRALAQEATNITISRGSDTLSPKFVEEAAIRLRYTQPSRWGDILIAAGPAITCLPLGSYVTLVVTPPTIDPSKIAYLLLVGVLLIGVALTSVGLTLKLSK